MITVQDGIGLVAPLANDRERIAASLRERCRSALGGASGALGAALDHALATPGKLIRPLLLFDACRAVGGDPEAIFPAGLGTEYGHIASLIHDDIMDGDTARRGQETVHVTYGLNTAILAGDALIFLAFLGYADTAQHGVSAERALAAIRLLSLTCIEMCRGQALEAVIARQPDTCEEAYLEVVRCKTASFCRAVAAIGGILGGGDDAAVAALGAYGEELGLSFQIMDDLLCYDETDDRLGKSSLSDLRNCRVTLPVIYAIQRGTAAQQGRVREIFEAPAEDAEGLAAQHAELVSILRATGALERARLRVREHTQRARERIAELPPSEARERLAALAMLLSVRDH
jgi:geranylgeranyl diphosphate synthase type I